MLTRNHPSILYSVAEHLSRYRSYSVLLVVLLANGCHRYTYGPPAQTTDGLRYHAAAALTGATSDTMKVAVVVMNASSQNRLLTVPTCFPVLHAVNATVRSRGKEWNSEIWEQRNYPDYYDAAGRELPRVCVASLTQLILRPGAAHIYFLFVPVSEILGDSLQGGRYEVSARLRINGVSIRRRTPDLEIYAKP